ncbi:MAG: T9SS type A sorting domain-containing protein, partial [Bacteroidota bacterium]
TEVLVCPGDFLPDSVRFVTTGGSLQRYNYIIADTNGIVITVPFTDEFNFENLPAGVCRVYGMAYDGVLQASTGDVIGEAALATGCFAISDNFITVTKQTPDAGTIATDAGADTVMVCSMDGVPDVVNVTTTSTSDARFIWVLTTDENVILSVQESPTFDFDNAPFGVCRIWGLSYQGVITAGIGDNAAEVPLASGCFLLSQNFVTVIREAADGGTVSLEGGGDQVVTCPGDGQADVVRFASTGTGTNQLFAVTDENDAILGFFDEEFDFEGAGEGVCRVWGLSFAGTLSAVMGDTITSATLATGCFDLSENFVTVIREVPDAGNVSLPDGSTELIFCSGDAMPDTLSFITDATTAASYAYVIAMDSFALTTVDESFDFSNAETGTFSIYGLAYTGDLNIAAGTNIFLEDLSTACFDLSDNAVTLSVTKVDAGFILGNGAEEVYFCAGTTENGLVEFTSDRSPTEGEFTYVITTANDVILTVMDSASFDFSAVPLEELRVYAISYTDSFLVGGPLPITAPLSTGCFTVSDNFVSIFTDVPEAGEISFDDVSGSGVACVVDGDGSISVSTTSTSLTGYVILVTDTANIIQLIAEDPADVPLGDLPEGDYRVHGLAYTGTILAQVGDDADVIALASSCYELTAAFLDVTRGGEISAGTLTSLSSDGDTIIFCDGTDNPIAIVEASVTGPNYRYLLTDSDGTILTGLLPSNIIPLTAFGPGEYRIYGFNFTGTPTVSVNQSIDGFLSTECYATTSNFITVRFLAPEGGDVTTSDGETEITLEIDDNDNATATFMADNTDASSAYTYVVTDENNLILAVSTEPTINFGPAGPGVCRVWGLAYFGEITAEMGDDAAATQLSDECFDLSNGFVTVTRTDNDGLVIETDPELGLINRLRNQVNLSAFPNPTADGVIFLELTSNFLLPAGNVYVRDLNGRAYAVQPIAGGENSTTVRLDISELPSGIYFAQYRTERGITSIRFMKR